MRMHAVPTRINPDHNEGGPGSFSTISVKVKKNDEKE
jgi:hypothetical protein